MAYPESEGARVNRSRYWLMFFVTMVASIVLIGLSIGAFANGSIGLGIIAFLLIAPLNIYFRVIMMRRCRDIGWAPALPWITFGLGIVASIFSFGSLATMDPTTIMGGSGFSMLVSLADLVLMIALGSVRGKPQIDYRDVFDGHDSEPAPQQRTGPRPAAGFGALQPNTATGAATGAETGTETGAVADGAAGSGDAMDDAIARALENYKRTGSAVPEQAPAAPPAIRQRAPQAAPARVAGFGRKMV